MKVEVHSSSSGAGSDENLSSSDLSERSGDHDHDYEDIYLAREESKNGKNVRSRSRDSGSHSRSGSASSSNSGCNVIVKTTPKDKEKKDKDSKRGNEFLPKAQKYEKIKKDDKNSQVSCHILHSTKIFRYLFPPQPYFFRKVASPVPHPTYAPRKKTKKLNYRLDIHSSLPKIRITNSSNALSLSHLIFLLPLRRHLLQQILNWQIKKNKKILSKLLKNQPLDPRMLSKEWSRACLVSMVSLYFKYFIIL